MARLARWLAHALAASLALVALAAMAQVVPARTDEPAIVVTPGDVKAFYAAVQQFKDLAQPPDPERAARLREMISDGMTFSSVLLPLADAAFLGDLETKEIGGGPRYDCADWTQGGADALVAGVIASSGQDLIVDYEIWDTARCVKLGSGRFQRPANDMIRTAKLVADDVVHAFTGTAGVAGTEIAFISDRSGDREVWVMDADGGRQRKGTSGRSIKAFPSWMPDGGAILYTSYQDGALPGLYLTSRGEYRPGLILGSVLPGLPKYRGVFSPTGQQLALVTSFDGAAELFRVDRSGRRLHRLSRNAAIDISPTWSPDGSLIAFVSDRSGTPQIYVMQEDGSGVRRLTFNGTYNTAPAWSPDGRWIAYETRVEAQFDIWLIDPSGEVNLPLVTHRRSDESPSWSPDGRKIVFSSQRRGRAEIYAIDLNGENIRRLTSRAGENLQPSWGPFAR